MSLAAPTPQRTLQTIGNQIVASKVLAWQHARKEQHVRALLSCVDPTLVTFQPSQMQITFAQCRPSEHALHTNQTFLLLPVCPELASTGH